MSEKDMVEEARELLANATPGQWTNWFSQFGDLSGCYVSGEKSEGIAVIVGHVGQNCPADAKLIARAPELLRALADEVERLRRICDIAMKGVGAPIMHGLAQEALRQLRTARPKREASHAKH